MKTRLNVFAGWCALLISASGQAQQVPFDVCVYPTNYPSNERIYYGNVHTRASHTVDDSCSTNIAIQSYDSFSWSNTNDEYASALAGISYTCGEYTGFGQGNIGFWQGNFVNDVNNYLMGSNTGDFASLAENHTSVSFNILAVKTNDPCLTFTESVSRELLDPYTISSDVNYGDDHGADCDCHGMPKWFVTEPFMNLWVKDTPVFYRTSLGEEISFQVAYKQHDTRPGPLETTVPPTGWNHNWFSYVHFLSPVILSSTDGSVGRPLPWSTGAIHVNASWAFTNDFSRWQAILYATDGGEDYFDQAAPTEVKSGLQLVAASGSAANGFRLVHPDGSVDEYSLVSSPAFSFGLAHVHGGIRDLGTHAPKKVSFGSQTFYDTCTNNYVEDPNDANSPPPLGQVVGYVACDALLTRRLDPYGNPIALTYAQITGGAAGTNYLLQAITDYDNKTTTLAYDSFGLLTNVSMPYGKSASFTYVDGLLTGIKDAQGMSSAFSYTAFRYDTGAETGTNQYLSALATPYETTVFEHYEAPSVAQIPSPPYIRHTGGGSGTEVVWPGTTPVYVGWFGGTNRINKACRITHQDNSQELYLYRYDSRGLVPSSYPAGQIPNSGVLDDGLDQGSSDSPGAIDHLLSTRNSFYWNRQQCAALATNDYQQFTANAYKLARMQHWLETDVTENFYPQAAEMNVSDQASLVRRPSPDGVQDGAKTWITHGGQSVWRAAEDSVSSDAATLLPNNDISERTVDTSGGHLNSVTESYTTTDGSRGMRTTSYVYETNGQLTAVGSDCGGLSRTYYSGNLQMDETDSEGHTSSYFYNSRHQLTGIKHANGLTTTNLYGSDGFLTKRIDLESHATNTYTFASGLPATRITPLGLQLNFSWDNLDRLTQVDFPDGTSIVNTYNRLDVVAHKNRLNHWTYASYDFMRQPQTYTDANGGVNTYSFCFCGGLESITDPLQNWTSFDRDYDGNVTNTTSSDGFRTVYTRNIIGQVTSMANSAGVSLSYLYNNQGLATNVSSAYGQVFAALYDECDLPIQMTDAQGVSVTNYFDTLGRLTRRDNAYGTILQNSYSAQGITQHKDALNHLTSYGYDPAGRLAAILDANNNTNEFTYNSLGELATLTDGNGHVTSWTYDSYGNRITKTDGNNVLIETNGYNVNGWRTAHWTPAKGLTHYTLDANGNLTGVSYSSGPGVTAGYDGLNRITSMSDAVGTHTNTYLNFGAFQWALATEAGPWATLTNGYANRVPQKLSLGSWTENYGYDGLLRLQTLTSPAGTFTYSYNGAGRQINHLLLPGSENEIDYSYDGAGSLLSTALKHGSAVLDAYTYTNDANGNRISVIRADNAVVNYGYDPIGQLVSAVGQEAGGLLRGNENFGYGYDAAGNLLLRTNNTLIQTFTTDGANQLLNITRNNDSLTVAGSLNSNTNSFTINGQPATIYNDWTFAVTNGVAINNGYNVLTAVVNGMMTNSTAEFLPVTVNIANDANGNLISDGLHGFDYNCANELVRVTVTNILKAEFVYDGFGRRSLRKEFTWRTNQWIQTNEVRYVWDGMTVMQERDSNNVPKVTYTRGTDFSGAINGAGGIGGLLARTDTNGSAYFHADGNGNITMLIDSSTNQLAKYLYDPFGNPLGMWGPLASANTYRHSSMESFDAGGIDLFVYRIPFRNLHRWGQRDPIEELGGVNLYQVVLNNPNNIIDPDGQAPQVGGYSFDPTTGKISAQWHHPIPWDNSTYEFYNHQLVEDAGWSKSDLRNNQESLPLENHAGRHCSSYLDEVQRRLDQAEQHIRDSGNYTKPNCDKALRDVIKSINEDIKNGTLAPYNNKSVRPVPEIGPMPYKGRFQLNGIVNDLGSVLNLIQMTDLMIPHTEYHYYYRDGTIRDSNGNITGYWGA